MYGRLLSECSCGRGFSPDAFRSDRGDAAIGHKSVGAEAPPTRAPRTKAGIPERELLQKHAPQMRRLRTQRRELHRYAASVRSGNATRPRSASQRHDVSASCST
ncbi:DUF6053 domain-containing protein [Lysobacter enzymogenes]|uniref:DUF6053 domain-containing protein n=1 Tax=Lysobacter enzymogenes TaxID=69 RepID=UPI0033942780